MYVYEPVSVCPTCKVPVKDTADAVGGLFNTGGWKFWAEIELISKFIAPPEILMFISISATPFTPLDFPKIDKMECVVLLVYELEFVYGGARLFQVSITVPVASLNVIDVPGLRVVLLKPDQSPHIISVTSKEPTSVPFALNTIVATFCPDGVLGYRIEPS